MINLRLTILILLVPTLASAQVSIVNALPDIEQSEGLKGKLALSVSWRDDNNKDTELVFGAGAGVSYKKRPWLLHFVAKGNYEQENGEDSESSVMEHARVRFSVGEMISPLDDLLAISNGEKAQRFHWYDAIYFETFAQHEYDKFRALNARVLWGIGPAIKFVSTEIMKLMFGTAYMYEQIDFLGPTETELNHRLSNYIQFAITPSDRFSIESVTFAQFRFDDFNDHLLMSTIGLKVKATEWFGVELGGGVEYDSRPPPNIKNFGTNIKSNLFVEF